MKSALRSSLVLVLSTVLGGCASRDCAARDVRKQVLVGAADAVFSMMSDDAELDADAMRYHLPSPLGGERGDLVFRGNSLTLVPDDESRGGTFQLLDVRTESKEEPTRTCIATFVMIGGNLEVPLRYSISPEGRIAGRMETPRGTIRFP